MAILFITITMAMLVVASLWLKVPNASIPLVLIYIIFMIRNTKEEDINKDLDNNEIQNNVTVFDNKVNNT